MAMVRTTMRIPGLIFEHGGSFVHKVLNKNDAATILIRNLFFLQGGMITAMNIP